MKGVSTQPEWGVWGLDSTGVEALLFSLPSGGVLGRGFLDRKSSNVVYKSRVKLKILIFCTIQNL